MVQSGAESKDCSQTQQMKMDSTGTQLCVCLVEMEMTVKSSHESVKMMECVCMCI